MELNHKFPIGDKRGMTPNHRWPQTSPIYHLISGILNKYLVETGIEPVKQTHHTIKLKNKEG